jgi:hypothetical protein
LNQAAHLGFNARFFGQPEIVVFGGLFGRGRPGNLLKGGATSHTFLEGHPGRQGPPRPQKYTIFGWSRTMYTKTLLYVVEFKAPPKTQTSRDI